MDVVTLGMAKAAANKIQGRKRQQTMVVIGDSLTEQGGFTVSQPSITPLSAWTWANVLLGQRFEILKNAGIGGQTTTQIAARLQTDVIALNPGWCHLLCGTNNVGSGTTVAKADITAMLDQLDRAGIMAVLGTIPPRITPTYTGTMKADTVELNRWIVATARSRRNVILVDYFQALTESGANYASNIGGWNSTSDGVHLSAAGAFACGAVLAAALTGAGSTAAYPFAPNAPGPNLLPNPYLTATTPTTAPTATTVSGGAAASSTWSIAASVDMPALPWKVLTIPNGAGNLSLQQNANVGTAGLAVGATLRCLLEFDISNLDQAATAGQQAVYLSIKQWNGSTYTSTISTMSDYNSPNLPRIGAFRTSDVVVAVGTTVVTAELFIWGGGIYKLRRWGLYQTTALTP